MIHYCPVCDRATLDECCSDYLPTSTLLATPKWRLFFLLSAWSCILRTETSPGDHVGRLDMIQSVMTAVRMGSPSKDNCSLDSSVPRWRKTRYRSAGWMVGSSGSDIK